MAKKQQPQKQTDPQHQQQEPSSTFSSAQKQREAAEAAHSFGKPDLVEVAQAQIRFAAGCKHDDDDDDDDDDDEDDDGGGGGGDGNDSLG